MVTGRYWLWLWKIVATVTLSLTAFGLSAAELYWKSPVEGLPTEIEFGKPLKLVLQLENSRLSIDAIDLSPLQDEFKVEPRDPTYAEIHQGPTKPNLQSIWLDLYPRQVGIVNLPPLRYDHKQTTPVQVTVLPAREHNATLSLKLNATEFVVWQRQQIVVLVELLSPTRFFTLEMDPLKQAGFEILPLKLEQETVQSQTTPSKSDAAITTTRLGWIIFPLVAGSSELEIPRLEYQESGITLRRFYLPKVSLTVKPLPDYVPPTMPIGQLSIRSSVTPFDRINSGNIDYWTVSIDARGILPAWLPLYFNELKTDQRMEYLPAHKSQQQRLTAQGIQVQQRHLIPFKPLASGRIALPDINIQYFEPHSGRIERIQHRPHRPRVFGLGMLVWLAGLLIFLLGWYSPRLLRYWQVQRHLQRQRQQALSALRVAASATELVLSLRTYAASYHWPYNLTLGEFKQYWCKHFHLDNNLEAELDKLSRALYGGKTDIDLTQLKAPLLHALNRPKKRKNSSLAAATRFLDMGLR